MPSKGGCSIFAHLSNSLFQGSSMHHVSWDSEQPGVCRSSGECRPAFLPDLQADHKLKKRISMLTVATNTLKTTEPELPVSWLTKVVCPQHSAQHIKL
eukprot:4448711-Amphidinium_carterae.1